MSDIDVGQISEAINDKMDRDMNNQDTGIHHIIETYINETSGYRIWDDGYCEQWGVSDDNSTSVTFVKNFTDTNYSVYKCYNNYNSTGYMYGSGIYVGVIAIYNKTTTGFSYTPTNGAGTGSFNWQANGYLAKGEY